MRTETDDSSDESGFEESAYPDQGCANNEAASISIRPPTSPLSPAADRQVLPSIPLSGFGHSLVPDMAFGWRPKLVHGGPIPLLFNKLELPVSINLLTGEEFPVIFNGFRPRDTMVMHQAFAKESKYTVPHIPFLDVYEFLHRRDQKLKDSRPFVGMSPSCDSEELEFDSTFESGNLDKVVKIDINEYDLYMRADANTRGYHQWYYFSVTNTTHRSVKFNIVNFTKNESLYSQGMLPVVFSEKESTLGWHRAGEDVKYRPSKLNQHFGDRQSYFSLSFLFRFTQHNDKVFFAYAIPYTFTKLCRFLTDICVDHTGIVRQDVLCKSLSGVEVPLVTISNFSHEGKKDQVIITSRVHPGETHGSWMIEGLLRFLLSGVPTARSLLNRIVFTIVPCLNPDGVIMGNYRTGFSGQDLNRQFMQPDPILYPTIAAVKGLISRVKRQGNILAFLDLHAHSRKKSVFIYGPHYPLHSEKYYEMRVLPKLICDQAPQFRFAACRFRNEASKQKAARLVIWKEFRLANSYTVEGSFHGFLTPDRKTVPFTEENVLDVGAKIATGLYQYLNLLENEAKVKEEKARVRRQKHLKYRFRDSSTPVPSTQGNPQSSGVQTMEDVINSIKDQENLPADPGSIETGNDSSDSSSEDNLTEDQLTTEDQVVLHGQIASMMEEFSSLASHPKSISRPGTKSTPSRAKANPSPLSPDPPSECERSLSRTGCNRIHRSEVRKSPLEMKVCNPVIPLPRMAEYRSARSVSGHKKRPIGHLHESNSKVNMSSYVLQSRRLLAKFQPGKITMAEGMGALFPSHISALNRKRPKFADEDDLSDLDSNGLLSKTGKPRILRSVQKMMRPKLPVALAQFPRKKRSANPILVRGISQVLWSAKEESLDCI